MPRFDFVNRNGQRLAGSLELPTSTPRAYAVFAHCFTCSKNVKAASQVSRSLAKLGIAVLRFDFTGLGNSEGDFANSNFSSNVNDLIDASLALQEQYHAPGLLIGHSLGGAAALLAAGQLESVRAVATIGSPSEPAHVEKLIRENTINTCEDGSTTIHLGGRELRLQREFVGDLHSNRLAESLPELRKPLMIFHSPVDSVVSIDNARRLYELAKHPKSFVSIDNADHMLSSAVDAQFVAEVLSAWASRHLADEMAKADEEPSSSDGDVVEVREQDGGLTQVVRASGHEFLADEPASLGGQGLGPDPYDLLLSSLGTCTSMTLRMYANRKKWAIDSIKVRLKHSRIHANDCESCETKEGYLDRFEKEIVVAGELDEAQLARLKEIADRCPVHRTLMGEKAISTELRLGK